MQSFLTLIEQVEKELPSSERKIADYVLQNPSAPLFMTMTELAAAAGSSPAIVVRLCKRLNVDGYSDFKIRLSREVFSNESKDEESEQVMENLDLLRELRQLQLRLVFLWKQFKMRCMGVKQFLHLTST